MIMRMTPIKAMTRRATTMLVRVEARRWEAIRWRISGAIWAWRLMVFLVCSDERNALISSKIGKRFF